MIEAAMYLALGFCVAGMISLAILPAFYRRAARLTEEALRAVNPGSYAEVRASQDQERARHAVELRRVELKLQREQERSTLRHAEASRLQTELEALETAHRSEVSKLDDKLAARKTDENAMDLLSAEIKALKEKLSEAEKALADSWTKEAKAEETDAAKSAQKDGTSEDWLPATDAVALATITSLEAEVATLKAKLGRYEPLVAQEVENERTETARSRSKELEAQLVDTESKYIAAQSEVTRLSLQLDAANIEESDLQKSLTNQLEKLANENARHLATLKGKDREVARLSGQIDKLQQDLTSVPALTGLHQELRQLVDKISAPQPPQEAKKSPAPRAKIRIKKTTPVKTTTAQATTAEATPAKTPTTLTKEPASEGLKPKRRPRKTATRAAKETAEAKPAEMPAPPATPNSADIATAAEALVSRIIASNRPAPAAETTDVAEPGQPPERQLEPKTAAKPRAPRKPRTTKQKSKDVA